MDTVKKDVCIIGAGASGLSASLTIGMKRDEEQLDISMIVIEKNSSIGEKIRATGNGRCNISNVKTTTFGDTVKFFRKMGVEIKTDDKGRAYPVSERAEDVVKAIEIRCDCYNIPIMTDTRVTSVEKVGETFKILCIDKEDKEICIEAKYLVMATGGKAGSQFGSTGDGYSFIKKLGHTYTKLKPALAAVECSNPKLKDLKGIRAKGSAALYIKRHQLALEFGEIQFTKDGLSGISIFNLSKDISLDDGREFSDYYIRLNLAERYDFRELYYILMDRTKILGMETKNLLLSIVHNHIGTQILEDWSKEKRWAKDLSKEEVELIVNSVMTLDFKISGVKGWREAQVTSGGVTFDEFDYETMRSNKCENLYLLGELIDYDEICGGYNLENAWNTGRKAGYSICTQFHR